MSRACVAARCLTAAECAVHGAEAPPNARNLLVCDDERVPLVCCFPATVSFSFRVVVET
jgi:hypothetical protein